MKHCTLPTLLAVKTILLPAKNGKNSETGKVCIVFCFIEIFICIFTLLFRFLMNRKNIYKLPYYRKLTNHEINPVCPSTALIS